MAGKKKTYWYNKLGWVKYSPAMFMLEYRKKLPHSVKPSKVPRIGGPKRSGAPPYYDIMVYKWGDLYQIGRVLVKNYMNAPMSVKELANYATLKAAIHNADKIIHKSGKAMP